MTKIKRMAALLLALVLCLSLLPAALASGEPGETGGETAAQADKAPAEEEAVPAAPDEEPLPGESSDEPDVPEEESAPDDPAEEPAPDEPGETPEPAEEEAPSSDEPSAEASEAAEEPLDAVFPASDGESLLPDSLFLVQEQRGWCTLASATMMLRARLYLSGNASWSSVTQTRAYSSAWLPGAGLYFNFTFTYGSSRITVSHNTVSGFSVSGLKALLDKHPEGIVLYVYDVPHAILVTDYEGDTFYGSDPANSSVRGRRPISQTWLASQLGGTQSGVLNAADAYWYVSSYSIPATTYYTVSFNANGGTCGETSRTVAGGSAVGTLPTPKRSGYVFGGWYTAAESGTRVYDSTTVVSDRKLYAHWTPVQGSLSFSVSPLTINLARGAKEGTVTVSASGSLNDITLRYELDDDAAGALTAAWSGSGDARSRPMTFHVDRTDSGVYTATFYLYDADTDRLLDTQELTIYIMNADISLRVSDTNVVIDADEADSETVLISFDGISGKLPDSYKVTYAYGNPYLPAVSCRLGDWLGDSLPLVIEPKSSGYYPVSETIRLSLVDPEGEIWSEVTIRVSIVQMYGECGDNVLWDFNGVTLHIRLADETYPDGLMWNYEIGNAPWYALGDRIARVQIDRGVTRIGTCAFADCIAVRYVTLCDTLTEIGRSAFSGCSDLTEITVPGSVKIVDTAAFYGCVSMTSIVFEEGMERVASLALNGCSSLRTVTLPASLSEFRLSSRLPGVTDVYYGGTREQWNALDADCGVTDMLPANAVVHTARNGEILADASDAALILQYVADPDYDGLVPGSADADGDGSITNYDAVWHLRELVGLNG